MEMAKFHKGVSGWMIGMIALSPILIMYKLKLIPNWKAKESFLRYFFGGLSEEEFQRICEQFTKTRLKPLIKEKAMEAIQWHKDNGHHIIVVSASAVNWLKMWCETMELDLIATRLEVKDGVVTGRIAGQNCYGEEKARRVRETIDIKTFGRIYAYGDSKGDEALFQLATDTRYKVF
jgi:HAD superfamily hydrolase (TIGR01490 family)